MDIVIPSRGRSHLDMASVRALEEAGLNVSVVVPVSEVRDYTRWSSGTTRILACPATGIANTRQWIVDNVGNDATVCMVDDDLTFFHRRSDDPTKLRAITPEELCAAFDQLERTLSDSVPHAGFATREGANRNTDALHWNTRILRVLAYHRPTLVKEGITFGRMLVMEDFDVALRLLRTGRHNVILNNFAHNQPGSGTEGGCSVYRTMEVQAEAAHQLAKLHPGFVRVVEKETKTSWGGQKRTDVQISWKKALAAGEAVHGRA